MRTDASIGIDENGELLAGPAMWEYVREEFGEQILLSISGKDSLAMWLALREWGGFDILPFYMFWVPGSPYESRVVDHYEQFFGQRILRLPAPMHYWMLNNSIFQAPHNVAKIQAMNLVDFDFADVEEVICHYYKRPGAYTAVGMRAADTIHRRNLMIQKGTIGTGRRRYFFAIWDWNLERTCQKIVESGIKIPKWYDLGSIGTTPIAWDYKFIEPLKRTDPEGWETYLKWFPLADLEIFRHEQVGQNKNRKAGDRKNHHQETSENQE